MPRKPAGVRKSTDDPSLPKYSIAVASDLSGISQQQLRRMEEGGLVAPGRTNGNTRRYSDDDIAQIAEISNLSSEGINAAGIRHIVQLQAELRALGEENAALQAENAALREQLAVHMADAPSPPPAHKATRASHL